MAKFSRIEVAQIMSNTGLVPLFYHGDIEVAKALTQACYNGGARLLEFTSRGDFAHEVFTQLVKYCRVQMPELAIGVGSVVDGASASMYMALGADFIITPVLREDVAIVCNRRKVLWSPGCGSLSDIARAEELGCEIVKLFPGDVYGPKMVKAIKGPQPWTSIMPTGGVTLEKENLKSWFDAGVTCVGIGSQLVSKSIIEQNDYATLEQNVRLTLKTIKELRK